MKDTSRLHAHLALALAVGLTGCTEGDKPNAGVHVDLSKAGGGKTNGKAGDKAQEKPDVDPSGGLADGAEADGGAGSSGGPEIAPPAEVLALCPSGYVHKDEAVAQNEADGRSEGCPYSIPPPTDTPGPARYALLDSNVRMMREAGYDDWCCYAIEYPERGRPLVEEGRPRLPTFVVGSAGDTTTGVHRRVAAGWLHDARMEWASVAAFGRAREELSRLGAPRWLLDAHAVAADDERRHATMCLDLARRFAGRRVHLGPQLEALPRPLDLEGVLRSTFAEGAVAETIAALVARRASRHAAPDIAQVLARIADDETEHAALAWATIGWGWPRLSAPARVRLSTWARGLAGAPRSDSARPAHDPDARFGRLARATERAIAAEAWASCVEPLLGWLGSGPGSRPAPTVSINA